MVVTVLETGSEAWWQARQRQGIPYIEAQGKGKCRVTFWWRDPAGDERHSAVQRVWLNITGVTDHHQRARPVTLARQPGTDVWQYQLELTETWRGSYCLIPSTATDDFPPQAFSDDVPCPMALRVGWRKLFPQAQVDPFNPRQWRGGRGHPVCALEMPRAPLQPGWNAPDTPCQPPVCLDWTSEKLANTRKVWIFTTGDDNGGNRPLALLLDGQFWAQSLPVWPALQSLTEQGLLPPAVYVLIDAIDTAHRGEELPCNPVFWQAVQEELLPQIQSVAPWRDDPSTTVVAGQSFGGLSSLYAGLNWPERFGCVLSQSGSYWWPGRETQQGWLIDQLEQGNLGEAPLRIFLEAGQREPLIYQANLRLCSLLQRTQQQIFWREVDGGHDALCWRGGLTEGLITLWGDKLLTGC